MDHREMGRKYGYPECCIDWFCRCLENATPVDLLNDWLFGVPVVDPGYVLCPDCRKKVETRKFTSKDLANLYLSFPDKEDMVTIMLRDLSKMEEDFITYCFGTT